MFVPLILNYLYALLFETYLMIHLVLKLVIEVLINKAIELLNLVDGQFVKG